MTRTRLLAPFAVLAFAVPAAAQNPPARAEELAAQFTKVKSHTKTKHNVTQHKYKEVIAEAWIAAPGDHAGHYLSEEPLYLDIQIGDDGNVTGVGRDTGRYELRDARITNGLLTGTKQYSDGSRALFEAVFLKRSDRTSPDESPRVSYGLGMLVEPAPQGLGSALRLFAVRQ